MIKETWNDMKGAAEMFVRFGFAGFVAVTLSLWIVVAMTALPVALLFWIAGWIADMM